MLTSVSISQTTPPLLCLNHKQVDSIYIGLKSAEEYKRMFKEAKAAVNEQNSLIIAQHDSLIAYTVKMDAYDWEINKLIEDSKPKWYDNPWLWGLAGIITGVILK